MENDLTTGDLIRLTNYRDNLLKYIHKYAGYIGLNGCTYKKLVRLVKEHKRVTQFINEFEK